jgi:hypothetical protein
VLDVAYVGDKTRHLQIAKNYNAIPAGAKFLPQNRDTTVNATAANPGALPDVFLRPITGFGDITINEPSGESNYDSLQMQLTRRFTGGVELSGAYTWAKAYQNHFLNPTNGSTVNVKGASVFQGNPIPTDQSRFRQNIQEHVGATSYTIDVPNGSGKVGGRLLRVGCWTTGASRASARSQPAASAPSRSRRRTTSSSPAAANGAATTSVRSL